LPFEGLFAGSPEEETADAILAAHVASRGQLREYEVQALAAPLTAVGRLSEDEGKQFAAWVARGVSQNVLREFLKFMRGAARQPQLPLTASAIRSSEFFTSFVAALLCARRGWGYRYVATHADQAFGTSGELGRLLDVAGRDNWVVPDSAHLSQPQEAVEQLVRSYELLSAYDAAKANIAAQPFTACQPGWRVTWLGKEHLLHGTCITVRQERETWVGIVIDPIVAPPVDDPEEDGPRISMQGDRWWEQDPEWQEFLEVKVTQYVANDHMNWEFFCEEAHPDRLPQFPTARFEAMAERLLRDEIAQGGDAFDAAREMAQRALYHLWQAAPTTLADAALCRAMVDDPATALGVHLAGSSNHFLGKAQLRLLEPLIQAITASRDATEIRRLIQEARYTEVHTSGSVGGSTLHIAYSDRGYNAEAYALALAAVDAPSVVARCLSSFGRVSGAPVPGETTTNYGRVLLHTGGRQEAFLPGAQEAALVAEREEDERQPEFCPVCDLDDDLDDEDTGEDGIADE